MFQEGIYKIILRSFPQEQGELFYKFDQRMVQHSLVEFIK